MKTHKILYLSVAFVIALSVACSPQAVGNRAIEQAPSSDSAPSLPAGQSNGGMSPTSVPAETAIIPLTGHLLKPADLAPAPKKMIDDVESSGTGPEGRAPYGDSYKLNRFERPFLKDMTYVPDLDIHKFGLSEDSDWYYVTIQLLGQDPNNALGIDYGAEIDLNTDGFGDYILWARPPYTTEWSTDTVQVFKDSNFDTAGQSATQPDASDGNGYDAVIFDGSAPQNADPDVAWVRLSTDQAAAIQFAFKKSLTGPSFMLGVVSDSGLKDVSKFDYADHFTEAEAGSSVRNNQYYPLGVVYAVDNTCWEAYGIETTGYEPKLCQPILQPIDISSGNHKDEDSSDGESASVDGSPSNESNLACNPPPDCNGDEEGNGNYNPETCGCE